MAACYSCGNPLDPRERVFRNTLCSQCGKELHVCLNCNFYAPGAHWDCRETIPEAVRDKDRANFCDFFVLATGNKAAKQDDTKQKCARSKFDNLFET